MSVTIGMPFYNSEHTLPDAIRSVFAQSYQDWELLLIDDGSTDRSLEIARSVRDPRVRVISDGQNRRLHYRLNQITSLADRKYIARMDSDDIMHPDRIEKQMQQLESNPKLDAIGTAVYTIDNTNNPNGMRGSNPPSADPKVVLSQAILVHPTVVARAEWFRDNPYDEAFVRAEDYELWCRTYKTSSFAALSEPLHYYREGARAPWKYLKDYLQSTRTVKKILRIYGPPSVGWPHTMQLIIRYTLKGEMYRAATLLGKQNSLIRRRNHALSDEDMKSALRGLDIVARTSVPGLDSWADSSKEEII